MKTLKLFLQGKRIFIRTLPDFLVTWNIHRTQGNSVEGQHEWWEWLPNTVAPQVGGA